MDIRAKLLSLCDGDEDAVAFIHQLWAFFCVWDDAIDRDKHRDDDAINTAMMWALFGMHDSPFYRKHEAALRPAIMSAIASWMIANKFEKSGDLFKIEQAYFMRGTNFDLFGIAILLSGGFKKQIEALEFFRTSAPEDTLERYKLEHTHGLVKQ